MMEAFWLLYLALVKQWPDRQHCGHIGFDGDNSVPVVAGGQL